MKMVGIGSRGRSVLVRQELLQLRIAGLVDLGYEELYSILIDGYLASCDLDGRRPGIH